MTPVSDSPDLRVRAIEDDLARMADLALQRVTAALDARDRGDRAQAADVVAGDEEMDELCLSLEERIFRTQIRLAPVARDQRLLHVARIVCIALERVGDLASAIAELTPSEPASCRSAPEVQEHLDRLRDLALDGLTAIASALNGGDVSGTAHNAERAREARRALLRLVTAVATCAGEAPGNPWPAETVLLGRHLERTADNAKEIAGRLAFLATGRPATAWRDPPG
jgi:phosphate transport system protein